jgi:membrane protein
VGSVRQRLFALVDRLRRRHPWFDHVLRMVGHYNAVHGAAQAGAVTYFGFLSVFPILAIAFFVVAQLARVFPDAQDTLVEAIDTVLPGVVGNQDGQVPLAALESYASTVGLVGLLVLLYAGLGWVSGLRLALELMFVVPRAEHPSFLLGKVRDLGALAVLGLTLLLSVALSGAVNGFSGSILAWLGIDPGQQVPEVLLNLLGHALAIAASMALLLEMFGLLLVDTHVPRRGLVQGALLGAVGFELLKLAANLLLAQTRGSPAFQVFGVALILVVWINYFSRLVMYSAAWAYTSPRSPGTPRPPTGR